MTIEDSKVNLVIVVHIHILRLESDALRYIQLHFEAIWRLQSQQIADNAEPGNDGSMTASDAIADGSVGGDEDPEAMNEAEADDTAAISKMDRLQLSKLLNLYFRACT